jgi:uncharacterized alpha-E superfamily protein
MERADGLLRVMQTNYILSLDKGVNNNINWRPILQIFSNLDKEKILLLENDTDAALKFLILDVDNLNSLKIILTRARENARGVQDHITKEVWEQVNHMYHLIIDQSLASNLNANEGLKFIDRLTRNSLLFTGVIDTTMPRGTGWNFMNLGRYIERCLQTLEIADKQYSRINYDVHGQQDILQWRYLLLSLSGYELHLKTYRTTNYNSNVLHQVLINPHFTRSVFYSLTRAEKYLHDVVNENKTAENEALVRLFGRLYSRLQYVDFDTLNGVSLQRFLQEVRIELLECSKKLAQNFFSYS